ncbi:MAG: rhodanese-like domain-containing protein, partial [Nitrosomonadaceae bacterium]
DTRPRDHEMKRYLLSSLAILFIVGSALAADEVRERVDGAVTINTVMAKSLHDQGLVFIDVRRVEDFNNGHIPGSKNLPVSGEGFTQESLIGLVQKDQGVVFYCNGIHCKGSSIASEKAVSWGWSQVHYYREGWPEWKGAGLPIE